MKKIRGIQNAVYLAIWMKTSAPTAIRTYKLKARAFEQIRHTVCKFTGHAFFRYLNRRLSWSNGEDYSDLFFSCQAKNGWRKEDSRVLFVAIVNAR